MLVAGLDLGAATPGHEFRVLFHVRDQIEHLGGAVGHQDGSLYFVHRLSQMARMTRFYRSRSSIPTRDEIVARALTQTPVRTSTQAPRRWREPR